MVFLCSDGLRKLALGIAGEQFRLRDAWRSLQVRRRGGLDLRNGMGEFEVKKMCWSDHAGCSAIRSGWGISGISQGPRPSKRKAEPQVQWSEAVLRARNSLQTRGFCPVGGSRCRQFSHPVSLMIRHLDHLTAFHQAEMIVNPAISQEIDGCRNGRVWICQRWLLLGTRLCGSAATSQPWRTPRQTIKPLAGVFGAPPWWSSWFHWPEDFTNNYGYIYIYICGLVPCSYPPNCMGPQVAPGPFYLQAIGSISEAQPRIC